MPVALLVALKVYVIVGEMMMLFCLWQGGRAVAEIRQVRSWPVVISVVIATVLLWPIAFLVRED